MAQPDKAGKGTRSNVRNTQLFGESKNIKNNGKFILQDSWWKRFIKWIMED